MIKRWKEVRVFISSTFKDFHAERDLLVRDVFPKLKERLRKCRVHLVDIDLRWGVSEEDARSGNALDICLDEIDSCRPYFLGLLGHRYGWKPDGEDHSITASEIYHGVLKNDIPAQIVELRSILEDKFENVQLSDEQKNCLSYNYKWDGKKGKYLLRNNVERADLEMIRSIFAGFSAYQRDRSFFFFRSEELSRELAEGKNIDDFFDSDPQEKEQLDNLKQEIEDNCQPPVEYFDLEEFGEKVEEILWKRMELEFADADAEEKDELEIEADFHELFIADRTRHFVGREELLGEMLDFLDEADGQQILAISGKPGVGKSALLGQFTGELLETRTDYFIIPHFVGASPSSTGVRNNLIYWSKKIARELGEEIEIPGDINELKQLFESLLEKISKQKRTIFVIDAVNQLEKDDYAQMLRWLPWQMPENVKFIISTLPGKPLEALRNRGETVRFAELTGLTVDERKRFVERYLKAISHEFPHDDAQVAFFEKIEHGHPLYIQVALEELRLFGEYHAVMNRILQLPGTIEELFEQVLERIEGMYGRDLVQDAMCYIACGRQGMTAPELKDLLKQYSPQDPDGNQMPRLPDMLWSRLYRSFSGYLFEREGVIDFFHGQLKTAVGNRYLREKQGRDNYHRVIADYFEFRWQEPYARAVDELPHQIHKAGKEERLHDLLLNYVWLRSKLEIFGVNPLVEDYDLAPDTDRTTRLIQGALELSSHVLNKDVKQLPSQLCGRLCGFEDEELKNLIDQVIEETKTPWLRPITPTLTAPGGSLVRSLLGHSGPVNSVAISHDGSFAISGSDDNTLKIWDLGTGEEKITLSGHSGSVNSVAISDDGLIAVSGSSDKTIKIWDLKSGIEIRTMQGHKSSVSSVCISSDIKFALSGSDDGTLKIWNLKEGIETKTILADGGVRECQLSSDNRRALVVCYFGISIEMYDLESAEEIGVFDNHSDEVTSVCFSKSGKVAISGSDDKTVKVWNLETGKDMYTLQGHSERIISVCLSQDDSYAISGDKHGEMKIWNLQDASEIVSLSEHSGYVNSISVSNDGTFAISGADDGTLKIWNLAENIKRNATRQGHSSLVTSVSVSSNDAFVISASWDGTLKMWDVETGKELNTLKGHSSGVNSVSISPDGSLAISGAFDGTAKVWDLKTGRQLKMEYGQNQSVKCVFISSKEYMASYEGNSSGCLIIWDIQTGTRLGSFGTETRCISSFRISPDVSQLVTSYPDDNYLIIWDLQHNEYPKELHGHSGKISDFCLSPDGSSVVSGSWDGTLKIWDLATGNEIKTLRSDFGRIESVSISPNGEFAVSVSADNTLVIWDYKKGTILNTFNGFSEHICISPESSFVLAGSVDNILKILDSNSSKTLGAYFTDSKITRIKIDRRCRSIVAGDLLGKLHFLRIENFKPAGLNH